MNSLATAKRRFIQTTARPLACAGFVITQPKLNQFVCFLLRSNKQTMPKSAKAKPKKARTSHGPYPSPATSAIVTPDSDKKSASAKHDCSTLISKTKVATGLNLAQKAEELYIGAEVLCAGAALIGHHIASILEWKSKSGASSATLNDAARELKCLADKLRECDVIVRCHRACLRSYRVAAEECCWYSCCTGKDKKRGGSSVDDGRVYQQEEQQAV